MGLSAIVESAEFELMQKGNNINGIILDCNLARFTIFFDAHLLIPQRS
jgi:hypothetical protein